MQKRQSHRKSRNGCQNCKRRHVKCDEQGPPCANCVVRKTSGTCDFQTTSLIQHDTASVSASSERSTTSSLNPDPEARRLLEMELMHRWATFTYKGFCSIPEDTHYAQVVLPRGAWKHDFLLNGILATAALEIAMCEDEKSLRLPRSAYVNAALEFYDVASQSFRRQLCDINKENLHFVYIFAAMAAIINMAMPRSVHGVQDGAGGRLRGFEQSMMERMNVLLNLFSGAGLLVLTNWEWIVDSPILASLLSAITLMEKAQPNLDTATEAALARLDKIVETRCRILLSETESPDATTPKLAVAFQTALRHLKKCFIEDNKDMIKGFCISFPMFAGRDFALAFERSEPVALFIVMHWGVLLDRLGELVWWAKDVGRSLVLEISEALAQEEAVLVKGVEWREGIVWARERVGLPAISVGEVS